MLLIPTRVAPSPIHGLGLFAMEMIPVGTPVWQFQGGFDQEFFPTDFAALPDRAQDHIRWFSFVRPDDQCRVLSGDHACFMNHSSSPNTGSPEVPMNPLVTVAHRPIAVGDEITCDYFSFDAEAPEKLSGSVGAGIVYSARAGADRLSRYS